MLGQLATALAALALFPFGAGALAPPSTLEDRLRDTIRLERARHEQHDRAMRRELRRVRRIQAPTVQSAFALANVVYGVPVGGLSRLAWCESRHRPWARNRTPLGGSHASGLTQILYPSTWNTTPYRALSPYDAAASALAAGFIWRRAGGSFAEWADVCASYGNG